MIKEVFESMFSEILIAPLINLGFQSNGKSLFLIDKDISISLIRLGGKMSIRNGISQILCFRHTFLPNLDEKLNNKSESNVFAYPIKLKPSKVKMMFGNSIKYKANNLQYDYEKFTYENKSDKQIEDYLLNTYKAVIELLKWAKKTNYKVLEKQIFKYGESAWIEKLWLKSYSEHKLKK